MKKGDNKKFYSSLVREFLYKNGVPVIAQSDLSAFPLEFVAAVLRDTPFTHELIDLIPQYLPGHEELFWETVVIAPYDAKYSDYDIKKSYKPCSYIIGQQRQLMFWDITSRPQILRIPY